MPDEPSKHRGVRLIARLSDDPLWYDGLPANTKSVVMAELLTALTDKKNPPTRREKSSISRALATFYKADTERMKLEHAIALAELRGDAVPLPALAMQVNGDVTVALPDLSGMTNEQLLILMGGDEDEAGPGSNGSNGSGDV